jgi:Tol biopolymer transport system component
VIETCDLQGAQRTLILSEPRLLGRDGISSVYWLHDGRILYNIPDPSSYSDYNVWAIAADVGSGKRLGPPARLTSREKWAWDFQASADGKRLIYMLYGHSDAIYLANLRVGTSDPRRLTLDEWDTFPSDWTRDSAAILFQSIRNGRFAVLQQQIDKQTPEILLSGAESYQWPILSTTGNRLLYTASPTVDRADPSKRLMSMPVNGGLPSVLLVGGYSYHCGSLPSARCVLGEVKGHQLTFYILDAIEGKGAEIHSVEISSAFTRGWALSPDGQKIAIILKGSEGKIGILTLADRPIVTLVLRGWKWDDLQTVAWSADGSHLFATAWADTSCALLSIDPRGNLQVLDEANSGEGWLNNPVASPDGRYLAYMKRTYDSNVVMLEHF